MSVSAVVSMRAILADLDQREDALAQAFLRLGVRVHELEKATPDRKVLIRSQMHPDAVRNAKENATELLEAAKNDLKVKYAEWNQHADLTTVMWDNLCDGGQANFEKLTELGLPPSDAYEWRRLTRERGMPERTPEEKARLDAKIGPQVAGSVEKWIGAQHQDIRQMWDSGARPWLDGGSAA